MAWARITFRSSTADETTETEIEVGTDTAGYPDVLAELRAQVVKLHHEVVGEPAPEPEVGE